MSAAAEAEVTESLDDATARLFAEVQKQLPGAQVVSINNDASKIELSIAKLTLWKQRAPVTFVVPYVKNRWVLNRELRFLAQ